MKLPLAIIGSILLGTAQAQEVTETNRPLGTLVTQALPHTLFRPEDLVELPDGDLVLLANYPISAVVRLKPDGGQRWAKLFSENLTAMVPLDDGGFLVVGSAESNTGPDFTTTMLWLDASGQERRRKTVGGGVPSNNPNSCNCDSAHAVVPTADEGYLLIGGSSLKPGGPKQSSSYGGLDGWIIKVDREGNRLWDRSFGGSDYDILVRGAQLPDQGFILAGFSSSPADGSRTVGSPDRVGTFWLVRIDADGNQLWERSYHASVGNEALREFLVARNGDFVLSGINGHIVRTKFDGTVLWSRHYAGFDQSLLRELPDGRLLQASAHELYRGNEWIQTTTILRCLSAGGEILWEKSLPKTGGSNMEAAALVASDRSYWVASRGLESLVVRKFAAEDVPTQGNGLTLQHLPEFRPSHPNGYFSVNGPSSTRFVWEGSPDLSAWLPLSTNQLTTRDIKFPGGAQGSPSHQFFRARQIP
jgi:hypothetical protein